ncbi:hypothetical protein EJD97_023882 [Solanum chilense]|uniref:CCHC-type domain-containing protein n=1 Tax=Solanum chilense TaxID=4083 RepID=A0A6N2ARG1_SOLCI|nr:hypothetical protein EJD97_023882 [Solanum chilense]
MVKVVKVYNRLKDYLEDTGYEKCSRVHLIVNRARMMTSNIVECINNFLVNEIVLPPRYRRLVGRPSKRKKKNAKEKITVKKNSCGQCGQERHNKRTCTFFPKEN